MIRAALLVFVLLALVAYAVARDTTGLSAQLTPDQNEWVKGLHDSNGVPCCDDTDGIDPVWRVGLKGFEVYHQGEWLKVAPESVLHQVNRIGVARAWLGFDGQKHFVRCFLAGAQT